MGVISKVQLERAQLRVHKWFVVDGDLENVQQSQQIGGGPHVRLLLFSQDNCHQYLLYGLISFFRCAVGLCVER